VNENEDFSGRLQFLNVVIVLIIAVLIGRAGYLQVYDGELYARLAEGNRIRMIPAEAARGAPCDESPRLHCFPPSSDGADFSRSYCTRVKTH